MEPPNMLLSGSAGAWLFANLPAVLMIAIFLVMTGLMYARRISALLALPIMALLFAVVGLVRVVDFFTLARDAAGAALEGRLRWSFAAMAVLCAAGCLARRRFKVPFLGAAIPVVVGAFLLLLWNMDAIVLFSMHGAWNEMFKCLEVRAIMDNVIHDGALKLHDAYTVAFFGGMLAIYVKEKKLAEAVIKFAAEMAGDRPLGVAIIMMLVIAALFTTLGGLGAIIMIGSIVLPIMLSLGLRPVVAAGVFLIGLCAGGTFNPGGWALYTSALSVPLDQLQRFALVVVFLYLITGVAMVAISLRGKRRRRRWTWAANSGAAAAGAASPSAGSGDADAGPSIRPIALLSPLLPIVLVFKLSTFAGLFSYLENPVLFRVLALAVLGGFGLLLLILNLAARLKARQMGLDAGADGPSAVSPVIGAILLVVGLLLGIVPEAGRITGSAQQGALQAISAFSVFATFWDTYIGGWKFIPAFIAGLLFCMMTTWNSKGGNIRLLTKSLIEGAESVMPAVLLMCGIGMLLQVVQMDQVKGYLQPLVAAVTPSNKLWYVIGFGLAAPLALYRGPLNVWGLGLGIAGVMQATGNLTGMLLVGMFMSVGAVQGVCDPTNTHNVWIANFLGEDVLAITRFLLPFIWVMVFLGLTLAALLF